MKNLKHHIALYIFEIVVLCSGFILILNGEFSFWIEFGILALVLILYSVIGIVRHTADHDMHGKVVLEYVSISLIISLLFLLVNSARI